MPGNPVQVMLARMGGLRAEASERMYTYYTHAFQLDLPIWRQYLNFWNALLLPAILLSWFAGNHFGAFAARSKRLDNTILPIGYILTATPYMWLAILLGWALGIVLRIFPISGAFSYAMVPTLSWAFVWSFFQHWFLPFASLFLVQFGGWAIGMRNMIIYELEADYSHYLEALGAPRRLVRKYAFNNAILPQITGLALQLGVIVAGAVATEIVFSYPGIGYLILQAILNQDYFLLQGCFLFIVVGVLLANFAVDVACWTLPSVPLDPGNVTVSLTGSTKVQKNKK